ncbi:contactin-2-like [Strongylocentrotus purpuratus]|uniref:Ig-like domain-containing protein n=1 Tax=Strongylocentrotus purpuratus TaxID=7668 RepID=A0A7M7T4W5_STRPU|nr:contactin-2-like [Strongylocentrotus purpuratus]|eukprot:XP_011668866.1 PREDICTED: contactin-2-like [Strongylocentrotus purpuratus]
MNTFNPTCLLLCLANLTFAWYMGYNDVPPSIVEQPESIYGDQRIPLTLTCRATGTPEPTYYWEKDGALFDVDSNDRASLDGGNLVIESLTTADDGQYQCFAKNRLGTAMSQKILTSLAFMDQFENECETVQTYQGRHLKLLCGGTPGVPNSNPALLIYWTDAAPKPRPITYNARVNQDPQGNLVFSYVIASDAQGYFCQAINKVVGSSQRSPKVTLMVSGRQTS